MLRPTCPHQRCPAPFCWSACPSGAISIIVEGRTRKVCIDPDKCNECGICRVACATWSKDRIEDVPCFL